MTSVRLTRARLALEGLSVGDAFGERFFVPDPLAMIERRALPGGTWPYTDDTAMALGIVSVLAEHGRVDRDALARAFAERYVREPWRGYGGTAHEILRALAAGEDWRVVSPAVFGGQGSMGNGAAMRVAPIGAYFADDLARVVDEARASAVVTHAHPEGQAGAIAIAVAAAWAATRLAHGTAGSSTGGEGRTSADRRALFRTVLDHVPPSATRDGIARAAELGPNVSPAEAVEVLGNGSRVIAEDTVPFALWAAARHLDDYEAALWTTVAGLGDRDTTCAIAGGIVVFTSHSPIPVVWMTAREALPAHQAGAGPSAASIR